MKQVLFLLMAVGIAAMPATLRSSLRYIGKVRNATPDDGAFTDVALRPVNSIQDVGQFAGATADIQILAAQAALPAGGGIVDATGYGCTKQTIAHQIALGTHDQPVILRVNPCTHFNITQNDGGVVFLMGNGSDVIAPSTGANRISPFATFFNSSTANISWDFAPANPGTQEFYNLEGLLIGSSPNATISGGLIQVSGVFINSRLRDIYTFNCYAPSALVITANISITSDVVFDNDNFDCSGHSTGPVVSIFAPTGTGLGSFLFIGGGIQHAGAGQPILKINGNSQGPSNGTGIVNIFFTGVQFETIGGGASCPIQLADAQHIAFNTLSLTGKAGTTAVCITETAAGRSHDISIGHMEAQSGYAQLVSATPFGLGAILIGVGATDLGSYHYNSVLSYVNVTFVTTGGIFVPGGNIFRVTSDFTTANNTNFQTIPFDHIPVLPANMSLSVPFECHLLYSQATAVVADSFGIQASVAPTNITASGVMNTNTTAATWGNLPTLSTTTATAIVTATPSAITTIWNADLSGMIVNPSQAANIISFMVKTSALDHSITIEKDSYCRF
jgi:hypothetical protein